MDNRTPEPEWEVSEELSTEELWVSVLMVLRSAAGFYIGRMCLDKGEDGLPFPEPYGRESGYYKTREEAAFELFNGFVERDCVENNHAYANGTLSRTAR